MYRILGTDGPVVIGHGVVHIGLVEVRIVDEGCLGGRDVVQPAVPDAQMVIVVELMVHPGVELILRRAVLNVPAIVVVVGARVSRHVGFGKIREKLLGHRIEHAGGYDVVRERLARTVRRGPKRIIDRHRRQIAVIVEGPGLREVPAPLQVGRKGGAGLK